MAIPVQIVAGFLGTGKTTFLRAQLGAHAGERVAVIVNDFGEAALDEATLAASGEPFQITNIPGGCVCCTAPEGFVAALEAVIDEKPDRILIEPTGLARPQDLIDTIRRGPQRESLAIAPVVVLVDPARLGTASGAERELVAVQAGVADVLVANRTDLSSADDLARFDALAASLWPAPLTVHRTAHAEVPAELLVWPEGEGTRLPKSTASTRTADHEAEREPHEHPPTSTDAWSARSFRWAPTLLFAAERLARAAMRMQQGLAGAPLARLKGVFRTEEGVVQLEVAGGQLHRERSAHRRDSRLDVIFEGGDDAVFERVASWLQGAVLRDEELERARHQIELQLPGDRVRIVQRDELADLPDGLDDVGTLFPKRAGRAARVAALWAKHDLPQAGSAVICASDGFASEPVPIEVLREGFLIHTLDDEALPEGKGGPFRLMIPESVDGAPPGCANVKGVTRIVFKP
jgi:G3E family GTPase